MSEYYGVVRAPNYLSHALERGSGGVAVYKDHKYIARAMTSSGKYRYFYDSVELAAYKNQRTKQTNSLTKGSGGSGGGGGGSSKGKVINAVKNQHIPSSYGHLSAGALKYQGENTPVNEPTKKKKKKTTNRRPTIRSTVGVPISSTSMQYYRR